MNTLEVVKKQQSNSGGCAKIAPKLVLIFCYCVCKRRNEKAA
jgi:hypothetical protein